ncbi:MAG: ornithine cyclodeaminase family protein [Clostridiales bacterium]|jgi:ornithine cyclodeaminase|nr:ornithine cyclodeaminase family protein [Clostridiales bacterium]
MIVISEKDMLKCVTYGDVIEAIEESFLLYEKKEFTMPHRMHIDQGKNTLLLMPCFGKDYFGTKLVTVYPENVGTGIHVVNGVVVLNNAHNGEPLALINGRILTALRTGAVGAVSVKHLSPDHASKLGIIGAGVQAFYQVMSAATVRKLTDITILSTNSQTGAAFEQKINEHLPGINTYVAKSAEELLENSQIVITATTAVHPVLPEREDLLKGKHYVGIGSFKPDVREFPKSLYSIINKVYVDTEHAVTESGDVCYPLEQTWITKEQIQTFGGFLMQDQDRDAVKKETTLFKSVGMAIFDLVVSQLIYEKAMEKGFGKKIAL